MSANNDFVEELLAASTTVKKIILRAACVPFDVNADEDSLNNTILDAIDVALMKERLRIAADTHFGARHTDASETPNEVISRHTVESAREALPGRDDHRTGPTFKVLLPEKSVSPKLGKWIQSLHSSGFNLPMELLECLPTKWTDGAMDRELKFKLLQQYPTPDNYPLDIAMTDPVFSGPYRYTDEALRRSQVWVKDLLLPQLHAIAHLHDGVDVNTESISDMLMSSVLLTLCTSNCIEVERKLNAKAFLERKNGKRSFKELKAEDRSIIDDEVAERARKRVKIEDAGKQAKVFPRPPLRRKPFDSYRPPRSFRPPFKSFRNNNNRQQDKKK